MPTSRVSLDNPPKGKGNLSYASKAFHDPWQCILLADQVKLSLGPGYKSPLDSRIQVHQTESGGQYVMYCINICGNWFLTYGPIVQPHHTISVLQTYVYEWSHAVLQNGLCVSRPTIIMRVCNDSELLVQELDRTTSITSDTTFLYILQDYIHVASQLDRFEYIHLTLLL